MAEGGNKGGNPKLHEDEDKKVDKKEKVEEKKDGITERPQSTTEMLMKLMGLSIGDEEEEKPEQLLTEVTFDGIAEYIKSDKCKNIITMAGAGISTSAGIPDFRSPGSGIYNNLAKYDLPDPMAVFSLDYFKTNPQPFYDLAKELWPGDFKPTPCHFFIHLLNQKGLLMRHYTQNIDGLERIAGITDEKIVEAHGTFHCSHCIECRKEYTKAWMKEQIFADTVPHCTDESCGALIKPDIVFFGEALPNKFFACMEKDFDKCDLLIVMGTSLVVQPFASLTGRVPSTTPRLYINLEKGGDDPYRNLFGESFRFDAENNYRDIFHQNTCDEGCHALANKIGWGEELKKLVGEEEKKVVAEGSGSKI